MKYRSTEILVGAFVLAGLFVIFAGIFVIRGFGTSRLAEYHALYENAAGVEDGTAVKYNGMLVGRVHGLRIDEEDPRKVRVTFVVRQETPITRLTEAKITKADLLGDPYVNLHQLESALADGVPTDAADARLPPGSRVLAGEPFDLQRTLDDAAAAIESLSALASVVKRQVEAVIEDVRRVLATSERLLSEENRAHVEQMLARLSSTAVEIESMVAENRERFDGILRNAEATSASFSHASAQLDQSLDTILPRAEALLQQTDGAVAEVKLLVATADDTLATLDMQRLNDLLDNLDTTTRNLAEFSRDLKDAPYRLIRPVKHEPQPARFGP